MNNEEKIVKLLEEIRDTQKSNLEKAEEIQKRNIKKLFWPLFLFFYSSNTRNLSKIDARRD